MLTVSIYKRIPFTYNVYGGSKILVTGHWSLVTGHWSLVTGHWSLVTGHWSLVTGHWSLVTGHWSLVTGHWSLVTGHWSLITGNWSLVTDRLVTMKCPLLVLTTDAVHQENSVRTYFCDNLQNKLFVHTLVFFFRLLFIFCHKFCQVNFTSIIPS